MVKTKKRAVILNNSERFKNKGFFIVFRYPEFYFLLLAVQKSTAGLPFQV